MTQFFDPQPIPEGGLHAPATARNKAFITEVLARHLPEQGLVLETASGTGEHVIHFAAALPHLRFLPTDPDPRHLDSIAAWIKQSDLPNLLPPVALNVENAVWPVTLAAAVLNINMIHISPWATAVALLAGAARVLHSGGVLYLYGPYKRGGAHTAPSNAAFDENLRRTDPAWGVRDLEAVVEAASTAGFALADVVDMPANNLSVVFHKRP